MSGGIARVGRVLWTSQAVQTMSGKLDLKTNVISEEFDFLAQQI
jgi:hypothetical protein